jgi:hypothetical protein
MKTINRERNIPVRLNAAMTTKRQGQKHMTAAIKQQNTAQTTVTEHTKMNQQVMQPMSMSSSNENNQPTKKHTGKLDCGNDNK